MRLLRWIIAVILIGSVLSCAGAADSAGPTAIDEPGAVSFSDLGWTEDIVVKGDSPPATVRVMLPEDAKQGERLWYGVRLDFEITGTPGPGEDRAYLVASWNQRAMYFMPLENVAALANGFSWTTHEPLSGWHLGYETTGTFPAASTSFAILDAIQGGMNEIAIRLDIGLASNPDFQARISKESQVVAVHWRETAIEGQGHAEISDGQVLVDFQGQNTGEAATDFQITAVIYRDDASVSYQSRNIGVLEADAVVKYSETIPITPGSPVFAVDLDLEWNGGRDYIRIWPTTPGPPWYERVPGAFRSTVGALVAIVVVWVGLPALVRRLRGGSREAVDEGAALTLTSSSWMSSALRRLRPSRWIVGMGTAGVGAAIGVAALLWIAPWSSVEGGNWRPEPTTLPKTAPGDREALERAAYVFLDMARLAETDNPLEVVEVGHVKMISRNGKRIGAYAEARLQPEVWVEEPLTVIRCGETLTWEGEPFWLDGVQVWLMDGEQRPFQVFLSDYHGELDGPDAHIAPPCSLNGE